MKRTLPMLALLVFLAAPACEAQVRRAPWYRDPAYYPSDAAFGSYAPGYSVVPPAPAYPAGDFVGNPVAAQLHGIAHIIRSRGIAYQAGTEGMINFETARSKYIDNSLQWTRMAITRSELIEQYRAEEIAERVAETQRWLDVKDQLATTPLRLTSSQLDPYTGAIQWPAALQGPDYAEGRKQIEELLLLKAHTTATPELAGKIRMAVSALKEELKDHVHELPPNQYLVARQFLESLAYYEGHLAAR